MPRSTPPASRTRRSWRTRRSTPARLYGPFRDAVDVHIVGGGDRKGYQQDWRNAREALVEVQADIDQGADMVMVKPALAYLDVIAAVRARVDVPLAAYHVSGEYSMIKAAAANGWIDHDTVALEHLTAIRRAGADVILTYLARWYAEQASSCMDGTGSTNAELFARSVTGDPRRGQLQHPGVQGRRRHAVHRRARRGAVRVGRRGHPLHRPRAELRRGHPRPRPPGDHRRRVRRGDARHVVRRADARRAGAGRGDRGPGAQRARWSG